jgi:AICAR transformylase/IMP cyclohydrolase PurH
MSYRFQLELIVDTKTAYFIKEYELNVPQLAVEAVIEEIRRQQDIRKVTQLKPVEEEIEDLKIALRAMRQQRDAAISANTQKATAGILQRIKGMKI